MKHKENKHEVLDSSSIQKTSSIVFTKINVENELSEARKFILENCERAINTPGTVDTGKEEIITKIFKGVTHQGVVDALEKFHTRVKKKKREL